MKTTYTTLFFLLAFLSLSAQNKPLEIKYLQSVKKSHNINLTDERTPNLKFEFLDNEEIKLTVQFYSEIEEGQLSENHELITNITSNVLVAEEIIQEAHFHTIMVAELQENEKEERTFDSSGNEDSANSNHATTTVNSDGTHSTTFQNGNTSTTVNPNGSHSTNHTNGGHTTTVNPDGTHTTTYNPPVATAPSNTNYSSSISSPDYVYVEKEVERNFNTVVLKIGADEISEILLAKALKLRVSLTGQSLLLSLKKSQVKRLKKKIKAR